MPGRYGEPKPWRAWYNSAEWKRLRAAQLSAEPQCAMCLADNRPWVAATVVDHKRPHRGDKALFFDPENLQSLCKRHHDSDKQMLEKSGRVRVRIGLDGYPVSE